jgi:hypothetical protein
MGQLSFLPSTPTHWPCCACERPAPATGRRRNRSVEYRCANPDCGITFEVMTPRELSERAGLTPCQTRQRIQGRRPFHHAGHPVVAWPKSNIRKSYPRECHSESRWDTRESLKNQESLAQRKAPGSVTPRGPNGSECVARPARRQGSFSTKDLTRGQF